MAPQDWYRWSGDSLELRVRAKTRSRREGPIVVKAEALEVGVNAPPVEGRANERLVRVLAEAFGVAKSRVSLVRGGKSACKWFRIDRPDRIPDPLQQAVGEALLLEKTTKAD